MWPWSSWSEFSVWPLLRTWWLPDCFVPPASWLHLLFLNFLPPSKTAAGTSLLHRPGFLSDQRGLHLPQPAACCCPTEPSLHLPEPGAISLSKSWRNPTWWTTGVQHWPNTVSPAPTAPHTSLLHPAGAVHLSTGSSVPQPSYLFHLGSHFSCHPHSSHA